MPYLCNDRSKWHGKKGNVAPVLASEHASSLPESPAWPGTHWKLRVTREEKESERAQIFQKDVDWSSGAGTILGQGGQDQKRQSLERKIRFFAEIGLFFGPKTKTSVL